MKMFFAVILGLSTMFIALSAQAAPFKAADKNPNVVSYYPEGLHGIPDEPGITHEGKDIVMAAGKSGNFQQWFYGTAYELDGTRVVGKHTVWKVKKGLDCPDTWTEIKNAYPDWGYHFEPGKDYCVKTNDFKLGGN